MALPPLQLVTTSLTFCRSRTLSRNTLNSFPIPSNLSSSRKSRKKLKTRKKKKRKKRKRRTRNPRSKKSTKKKKKRKRPKKSRKQLKRLKNSTRQNHCGHVIPLKSPRKNTAVSTRVCRMIGKIIWLLNISVLKDNWNSVLFCLFRNELRLICSSPRRRRIISNFMLDGCLLRMIVRN